MSMPSDGAANITGVALVTGSTGFIGSNLVRALRARGVPVRVLVRPSTRTDRLPEGVEPFTVDLNQDLGLTSHPMWEGVTHVFHVGGQIGAVASHQFHEGNVIPCARIAQALSLRATPPHLILVSSLAAHGPARSAAEPVRETDPPNPQEPYGRSKRNGELAALAHVTPPRVGAALADAANGGAPSATTLPLTILRPGAVYGPGDRGFLAVFRQVNGPLPVHAVPPHHVMSLVHVDDVIAALLAATAPAAIGRTYFVAHPEPISWGALYDTMAQVTGRVGAGERLRAVTVPMGLLRAGSRIGDLRGALTGRVPMINRFKLAMAEQPAWVCDVSALERELGWRAQIAHADGLRETAAWYRARGWLR